MIYRQLGKSDLNVSIFGVGCGLFDYLDYSALNQLLDCAEENGINLLDVYKACSRVRTDVGKALAGRRDKFIIQGHIGSMDDNGQSVRVRDIKRVKESFEKIYVDFKTDHIDIGALFYVDTEREFDEIFNSEVIEYALKLKEQGRITCLSMGSHNPLIALKAVKTGLLDALLFSINPAYEMEVPEVLVADMKSFSGMNRDNWQVEPSRRELYLACEQFGVGILVMKSYSGGNLLSAETSPFGRALSVVQCLHYGLSRPAVASVLVGCRNGEELLATLGYMKATDEEKDFSHIFSNQTKLSTNGRCMYCNHCQPCPSLIDIASVTKYLDLAIIRNGVTDTVRGHYFSLENNASDCILCGDCEENCPFGVDIRSNMEKARAMFHESPPA